MDRFCPGPRILRVSADVKTYAERSLGFAGALAKNLIQVGFVK